MALDLNGYIKMSYERPNRKVLEGLGASEDLIEYLMETPGNTNWNVIGSIANPGGGGDAEVWFIGDEYMDDEGTRSFTLSSAVEISRIAELYNNPNNYSLYLNDENLQYLRMYPEDSSVVWGNNTEDASTVDVEIHQDGNNYVVSTFYSDASTAPTSVEVSVKAK